MSYQMHLYFYDKLSPIKNIQNWVDCLSFSHCNKWRLCTKFKFIRWKSFIIDLSNRQESNWLSIKILNCPSFHLIDFIVNFIFAKLWLWVRKCNRLWFMILNRFRKMLNCHLDKLELLPFKASKYISPSEKRKSNIWYISLSNSK